MSTRLSPEERFKINLKIDLISVLENNGIEFKRDHGSRIRITCPFHSGDNEPSLMIYTDKKPHSWWCYGCSKGSDPVEFLRLLNKKTLSDISDQYLGHNCIVTIEDHVKSILENRHQPIDNRLERVLDSLNIAFSIKVRTFFRRYRKNSEKIREIQSILMRADDFVNGSEWVDMSEFDIKKFFRCCGSDLKGISNV